MDSHTLIQKTGKTRSVRLKEEKKFIEVEDMDSRETLESWQDFLNRLKTTTKFKLLTALEGHKPFANVKHQIANSG